MKRRSRLSRSRDFDAVYRHGRSVSSRYLVLYSFSRPEGSEGGQHRLGLAVSRKVGGAVDRNRLKRQLREAFVAVEEQLAADHDYVLVVRPGLAQAVETNGFAWLTDRVREVVDQAGIAREGASAP
jgi:ribonuclease P protein component